MCANVLYLELNGRAMIHGTIPTHVVLLSYTIREISTCVQTKGILRDYIVLSY